MTQLSQKRVDALVERLRVIGPAIGDASRNGHPEAKNIVKLYAMFERRQEYVAFALLELAVAEWERSHDQ
jgi:hypothetical protein